MKSLPLAITNADTATFDCSFGRGCEGICCRNGRPSVTPEERAVIESVMSRVVPLLRPAARDAIESDGFTSARTKLGQPMVRVAGGWCVFFNGGCVLHTIGTEDGDSYQYKPTQCALFPLERGDGGEWYVRQWNLEGEQWDLFCLNPANSPRPAVEALAPEMALAAKLDAEKDVPSSKFPVPS
jgi:Fe-S-cluster containining protein